MSPAAKQAFERITALQELTAQSGLKTYKSQSDILKALNPTDLADVAIALKSSNAVRRILSGEQEAR